MSDPAFPEIQATIQISRRFPWLAALIVLLLVTGTGIITSYNLQRSETWWRSPTGIMVISLPNWMLSRSAHRYVCDIEAMNWTTALTHTSVKLSEPW